jgi:RNA processing factor Prp31
MLYDRNSNWHMAIQFASVMYDLDTTANLGRQLIVDLASGICPEAGSQVQQPPH